MGFISKTIVGMDFVFQLPNYQVIHLPNFQFVKKAVLANP